MKSVQKKTNEQSFKGKALQPGDRVRLLRPFKNGRGEVFQAGSLGVIQDLKPPQNHLVYVRLDGYSFNICPFRVCLELK